MDVMDDLRSREASIQRRGDTLRVIIPHGYLPEHLKRELRTHKNELLRLLNPSLLEYIEILDGFQPARIGDLPPVPPFDRRPERPVAWSAWWETVRRGRRSL